MSGFGVLSYALACAAFTALAGLAFISDRHIPQGRALIVAAAATTGWAGLLMGAEAGWTLPYHLLIAGDIVRFAAWIWFLLLLAPTALPRAARLCVLLFVVGWALCAAFIPDLSRVLTRGGLVAALIGLVVLEQIHRNTPSEARGDIKFMTIGVGGLFAFDLYLFSQAELFHGFDPNSWHARGILNAILVPFLVLGAQRLRHVRFGLYVSRKVMLYTTAFAAVGIYALITAGVGFLIRESGGVWGEAVRLGFFGGAIAVLVMLIGSGTIRRSVRVFLTKHFYRTKYDYRHEWLRFIRTLSEASAGDVPAAAVRSVAQILDSPGGVLYRQPDAGTMFVPIGAWPATTENAPAVDATSPLIGFMRERRWIVDLREREKSPTLYDDVEVPVSLALDPRWRLVSPIFLGDTLLGFFLLLEPPADFRFTFEDRDLLNTAGQHVATLLAQQDADARIAELSRFEAYNRLTAFVMHDLKNCAAQLSLLVANAARHKQNPNFIEDAFATIAQTSERMTRLIEQLRNRSTTATARLVPLQEALRVAVDRCASRKPHPLLEAEARRPCIVSADPERLIAAFEHVIRNAQEASGEAGEVRVCLEEHENTARVSVRDTGAGMDGEFIRFRLFKPFDTTKGARGMGIGAYQARELARSLGGCVNVRSEPGRGTWFSFDFPLAAS